MRILALVVTLLISFNALATKPKPEPKPGPVVRTHTATAEAEAAAVAGALSKSGSTSGANNGGNRFIDGDSEVLTSTNTTVEGDDTLLHYEIAAIPANLFVQVCQDGTDVRGIKFGLSTIRASKPCMYLQMAQAKLAMAAALQCGDFTSSLSKSVVPADSAACLRTRAQLVAGAEASFQRAQEALEREGFLKRVWKTVW